MNNLDQYIKPSNDDLVIFDDVDAVVGRAMSVGDPLIAMEMGKMLIRQTQVSGVALAKLLYRVKQGWNLFEAAGVEGTFEEVAEFSLGYSGQTITKYVRMWESIFENENIDKETKDKLIGRPIGDLLLLTAAAREGNDIITDAADAVDRDTIRALILKGRGEQTSSKTAITIFIETNDGVYPKGTMYAMQEGLKYPVGYLQLDEKNDVTAKAIARIINSARIVEK